MFSSKRGCHPQRHEISREIQVDPGASIIMCPAKSAGHDLSGSGNFISSDDVDVNWRSGSPNTFGRGNSTRWLYFMKLEVCKHFLSIILHMRNHSHASMWVIASDLTWPHQVKFWGQNDCIFQFGEVSNLANDPFLTHVFWDSSLLILFRWWGVGLPGQLGCRIFFRVVMMIVWLTFYPDIPAGDLGIYRI